MAHQRLAAKRPPLAISFVSGLGNLAFHGILSRHLKMPGDYGGANSALSGLMTLLGLLPTFSALFLFWLIAMRAQSRQVESEV